MMMQRVNAIIRSDDLVLVWAIAIAVVIGIVIGIGIGIGILPAFISRLHGVPAQLWLVAQLPPHFDYAQAWGNLHHNIDGQQSNLSVS